MYRTVRGLVALMGTLALAGCESLNQFAVELAKEMEQANAQSLQRQSSSGVASATTGSAPTRRDVVVVLIHGTTHSRFLGTSFGGEKDWIQPGTPGSFAAELADAFKEADRSARVEVTPFTWGGDNSNPDRHAAAARLAAYLDGVPRSRELHVVGHSHGGNVALHALSQSVRDAETVTLLGTPHLGVTMTRARKGDSAALPLYLPLPSEASATVIMNVYSPVDSVTTLWADICPGTTFDDLDCTNAEAWRAHWNLDRSSVPLLLNKKQRRKRRNAGLNPRVATRQDVAVYDFETGDGVIGQQIPEDVGLRVHNFSIDAETFLDLPRSWVHNALHCPKVGAALGRCLGSHDFSKLGERIGVLRN